MVEETRSMLAPYRILDLTDEWGFLCGRLLADLGADVIKIEKPGGDPARSTIGPFYHDIPHPEKSLYWFFYNANKRGITLDMETADGRELFKKLVRSADFVVESFQPGYMDSLGLGYQSLSKINSKIIMTSITPFGQSGPYSRYKGSDIAADALSGWMYKCGDDDRAPLQMGIPQAQMHAAAQATGATLVAHYYRQQTGEGQQVDASPLPWMTYFAQAGQRWTVTGKSEQRHGQLWEWSSRPLVRYVWECKDGSICYAVMGAARFAQTQKAMVQWMDGEGMAPDYLKAIDWDKMDYGRITREVRDQCEAPIARFFKTKTKAEIFGEAVKRGIVLFPSNTAKELYENQQLAFRKYWVRMSHPELGSELPYPGAFYRSTETAWRMDRRAPLIGAHNEEVYMGEMGLTREELIMLKQKGIV